MRLGGWWRLWLATSIAYAAVVCGLVATSWPNVSTTAHKPWFTHGMSTSAQEILKLPGLKPTAQLSEELRQADRDGATGDARRIADEIVARRVDPAGRYEWADTEIEMPNGHILKVSGAANEKEHKLVLTEYFRVLEAEVAGNRKDLILRWFLIWFAPVVIVCIIGLTGRWIHAGFLEQKRKA